MAHINDKCDGLIFLAWGSDAFKMCEKVDRTKHHVIASSHPSGYSYNKTFNAYFDGKSVTYPSFESVDHFGKANEYLKLNDQMEIIWDLII